MSKSRPARGYTLPELITALTICGILLAIAVPRIQSQLDRVAVRSAVADAISAINTARSLALAGHSAIAVHFDSVTGGIRVRRGGETLLERGLGKEHGVRVSATRDSLTFDAHGLGHGAANLSIIVRLGVISDTLFVSRFGRIR
ncbi:MAG TPA: prepilin-type N-terminal cleavage/methylation domain-containing protein [Gemmatimonadaceae bacterium]|nr:prepilin-type N-terminal cleavage/methylation domain-containing protein [Gemmatimonadaceae bacterium]